MQRTEALSICCVNILKSVDVTTYIRHISKFLKAKMKICWGEIKNIDVIVNLKTEVLGMPLKQSQVVN